MKSQAGTSADDFVKVAALVAYDGSSYLGFQVQPGVPTIQAALEDALSTFTTLQGRVVGAGRTDTGVHARGQVVTAHVAWSHSLEDLQRAWNAHLPPSISIRRAVQAPEHFHPRFSASSRTYRYTVIQHSTGAAGAPRHSPLVERMALFERATLDLNRMRMAATALSGTHDFATYGRAPQGENTVRTVLCSQWDDVQSSLSPLEAEVDRTLVYTITANAFLLHMVRRVVGSMLEVGRGVLGVDQFILDLAACNGSRSAPPAPPNGLVLERVDYPPEWGQLFGQNIEPSSALP
jgi:tRNA pseudouridine38-40 synthase